MQHQSIAILLLSLQYKLMENLIKRNQQILKKSSFKTLDFSRRCIYMEKWTTVINQITDVDKLELSV